jgi:hypothetical protein
MLKIQNKEKLVGNSIIVGGNIWEIIGVYEYPPSQYQIHLRTGDSANLVSKSFILTEEYPAMPTAIYKITDSNDRFSSVWITKASVESVLAMLRTLKSILSHANN